MCLQCVFRKPPDHISQNILVLHIGPVWWVKIADFGISKRIESTSLRTAVGTLPYVAPEVIGFKVDAQSVDNDTFSLAVDIWSVGVITLQIVTGRQAFSAPALLHSYVFSGTSITVGESASLKCADFIKTTLAISPHRRPTSKQALVHSWICDSATVPSLFTAPATRYDSLFY
jgi:serine/threonine protein kinase